MSNIQEYDLVALTENIKSIHQDTKQSILLGRGQVGTVLMIFDDEAYLIDFVDSQGKTYAMETVPKSHIMRLINEPLEISP